MIVNCASHLYGPIACELRVFPGYLPHQIRLNCRSRINQSWILLLNAALVKQSISETLCEIYMIEKESQYVVALDNLHLEDVQGLCNIICAVLWFLKSLEVKKQNNKESPDLDCTVFSNFAHLSNNSARFSLPWGRVRISSPFAPPVPSSKLQESRWGSSPHSNTRSTWVMWRARLKQSAFKKGASSFSFIFFMTFRRIPFLSKGFVASCSAGETFALAFWSTLSDETDLVWGLSYTCGDTGEVCSDCDRRESDGRCGFFGGGERKEPDSATGEGDKLGALSRDDRGGLAVGVLISTEELSSLSSLLPFGLLYKHSMLALSKLALGLSYKFSWLSAKLPLDLLPKLPVLGGLSYTGWHSCCSV